jgi:hypothetical protein
MTAVVIHMTAVCHAEKHRNDFRVTEQDVLE